MAFSETTAGVLPAEPVPVIVVDDPELGLIDGRQVSSKCPEAARQMRNWRIEAMGHRPHDYMLRDLLLGGVMTDGRQWLFKHALKHKPTWLLSNASRLDATDRKQARMVRAFQFQHYLHAMSIAAACDPEPKTVLRAACRCWPMMALVKWTGAGERTERHVCKHAWSCPYCFSRAVLKVHRAVERKISERQRESVLVTGHIVVPESHLRQRDIEDEFEYMQRTVAESLLDQVREWGAVGGLTTYQIDPLREEIQQWSDGEMQRDRSLALSYRVGVLAEIPAPCLQLRSAVETGTSSLEIDGERFPVDWHGGLAQNQSVRRRTIFGEWPWLGYVEHRTGVFVWPALNLANAEQWTRRYQLTKGRHLYDTWGDWRRPVSRKPRHNANGTGDHQGDGCPQALRQLNAARTAEVVDRRGAVLPQLSPVWNQLMTADRRPPGRERLRQAAAEAGLNISERDARWFVQQLNGGH